MSAARKPYSSDLKDEQWAIIEPLVPAGLPGGRPLKYERREIVNAILYVLRAGCAWRMMPHDLPAWESVYAAFAAWEAEGTWGRIEAELRRRVRRAAGRRAAPTAAILDSQSVKMADQGGPRGHDVAKQTTGRKRHLLVDTLGLILAVSVTAAGVQDHEGRGSRCAGWPRPSASAGCGACGPTRLTGRTPWPPGSRLSYPAAVSSWRSSSGWPA